MRVNFDSCVFLCSQELYELVHSELTLYIFPGFAIKNNLMFQTPNRYYINSIFGASICVFTRCGQNHFECRGFHA